MNGAASTAEIAFRLIQGGSKPAKIRIDATGKQPANEVQSQLDALLDAAARSGRQICSVRADAQGATKLAVGAGRAPAYKGRPVEVARTIKPGSVEVFFDPRW
jgi:hypothetical protein